MYLKLIVVFSCLFFLYTVLARATFAPFPSAIGDQSWDYPSSRVSPACTQVSSGSRLYSWPCARRIPYHQGVTLASKTWKSFCPHSLRLQPPPPQALQQQRRELQVVILQLLELVARVPRQQLHLCQLQVCLLYLCPDVSAILNKLH